MEEEDKKSSKSTEDRKRILDTVKAQINKDYGKGSIMTFGSNSVREPIDVFSTGSLIIDNLTGIKGVPRGRIIEIYGHEGSGKTTLALSILACAQKAGATCAFIDAEHALDIGFAQTLGIDLSQLIFSQPEYAEQALDITDTLVRSGEVDLIVIDSVAALVPKSELEGDMGDSHMGLQARLMSQALRKITGHISKANALVIFINQIRSKIGVMFGNPDTTTGGNALKFYASMRFEVKRKSMIKKKEINVGHEVEVKIIKNKFAPPYQSAIVELIYGHGFNRNAEIVDLAVIKGILVKSGAWYAFKGKNIAQGREAAIALLEENTDLAKELFTLIEESKI